MHEFDETEDLDECEDLSDDWSDFDDDDLTEAQKAADYASAQGFDKAADYIEVHYDGGDFDPDQPIRITTRNMDLEGAEKNGVPFVRKTVRLDENLTIEGVFPAFDSNHTVDLGAEAGDLSRHGQFKACKEDFQAHMFDDPSKLEGMTFGDMFRMDRPTGYAPEGFTWHHNEQTGRFELVRTADHKTAGHTGGDAVW